MKKSKTNVSVVSNVGIRRNVNVHVGDNGSFPSGDILDANATKQLVDNVADSIGAAANTADLATVATTGSYNDLTNKPTIPNVAVVNLGPEDINPSTNPITITNQDKISQICDLMDAGTCVMFNSQGGPIPTSGFLFLTSISDGVNLTNVALFGVMLTIDPSGGG